LVYSASDNAAYSLIKPFEKVNAPALWPTLTSMRSVEQSGLVEVEKKLI
jgi:hypothetical protein